MAYRLDRRTVSIDEARGMLAVHGEPIAGVERLALDAAAGRVVARDVSAAFDIPPFARAVMDGYAVKAIDTDGASRDTPVHLTLVESIFTGSAADARHRAGRVRRIATGAPLPKGADSVVMVEQSSADGGHVLVFEPSRPGQPRRPRRWRSRRGRAGAWRGHGADAGSHRRRRSALGLTADLEVFARPRVAILSTGDEIVAPGGRLGPGQIFDANTSALAAAARGARRRAGGSAAHARTTGPRSPRRSTTPCAKTWCCSVAAAPLASATSASRF